MFVHVAILSAIFLHRLENTLLYYYRTLILSIQGLSSLPHTLFQSHSAVKVPIRYLAVSGRNSEMACLFPHLSHHSHVSHVWHLPLFPLTKMSAWYTFCPLTPHWPVSTFNELVNGCRVSANGQTRECRVLAWRREVWRAHAESLYSLCSKSLSWSLSLSTTMATTTTINETHKDLLYYVYVYYMCRYIQYIHIGICIYTRMYRYCETDKLEHIPLSSSSSSSPFSPLRSSSPICPSLRLSVFPPTFYLHLLPSSLIDLSQNSINQNTNHPVLIYISSHLSLEHATNFPG
jgi:hypothetical protein